MCIQNGTNGWELEKNIEIIKIYSKQTFLYIIIYKNKYMKTNYVDFPQIQISVKND